MNPSMREKLAEAQDVFVWEAPAHDHHARGPRWYVVMGIVALGFTAYAVFTGNFLFAFLILLTAIILVLAGNEPSAAALVQIGHNGVVWHDEFLPYDDMRDFAIVYQPPEVKVIYIHPKSWIRPRLRIPLGDQDPLAIRAHLRQYAHEDLTLKDEHATDILARLFRV